MIKTDMLTCHQDLVRGGCYSIPFNINYTFFTMKAFRQYTVIGPYNYDRIIHNIEKIYAKRQDIGQTNGKMHLV